MPSSTTIPAYGSAEMFIQEIRAGVRGQESLVSPCVERHLDDVINGPGLYSATQRLGFVRNLLAAAAQVRDELDTAAQASER